MTKARLMYLLVFAALLAFYAGGLFRLCLGLGHPWGMNDGGWID